MTSYEAKGARINRPADRPQKLERRRPPRHGLPRCRPARRRCPTAWTLPAVLVAAFLAGPPDASSSEPDPLDPQLHHLRSQAAPPEWDSFPETAEGSEWELSFAATRNATRQTLSLRQQDVKQQWNVLLNGQVLGALTRDENDLRLYLDVPADTLVDGTNQLRVQPVPSARAASDDIRVGEFVLHPADREAVLTVASLRISVRDEMTKDPLPARITIVDAEGALQPCVPVGSQRLAVRAGTVYTGTGTARLGIPPGDYTVFSGRGFEYSLASAKVTVSAGDAATLDFTIRREVPTPGYVACDTHVHTLTHSGHGDSTVDERMLTLAGEGIELPIATDHNVQIDHEPFARAMQVRQFFTPVIGNEVTTPTGHFNIFPAARGATAPAYRQRVWEKTFQNIFATTGVKVAILNHARDLHSGVRPFGPALFNDAAGVNTKDWMMGFNAMEVVNSSATQSDLWQLFHDWMALLNHGYHVTPVGCSDSHDVLRHFVGQGRTYIRCDDARPDSLDVDQAVQNFLAGKVMVSYGLAVQLDVADGYASGDLAPQKGDLQVSAEVLGPHWVSASEIRLFANGEEIKRSEISGRRRETLPAGIIWRGTWQLPKASHDYHLVAIAIGPGIDAPYWRTAKPYQPDSSRWVPHVVGCSGAVWVDADGDGVATSAGAYAQQLVTDHETLADLTGQLANYDQSVAVQAAHLYHTSRGSLLDAAAQDNWRGAAEHVQAGIRRYLTAWRQTQLTP